MMIAVLSDIHSNYIALKEVLKDAKKFNVEHLLILGDITGYYYWTNEVINMLLEFNSFDCIRGNHEVMLRDVIENKLDINLVKARFGTAIEKTLDNSKKNIDFLLNLPENKKIILNNYKFFLCHGSPFEVDKYIYPDSDISLLKKCALEDFDFVLMGHTHFPFCFHHKNTTLTNPGSVGQPRDIGNLSSYLIINTDNKTMTFRRIPFDIKPIIEASQNNDPDKTFLRYVFFRNSIFYGKP